MVVRFMRCLADEFELASHEEDIYRRIEDVEQLFIVVVQLHEVLQIGIQISINSYVHIHKAVVTQTAIPHSPPFDECIRHVKLIQTG